MVFRQKKKAAAPRKSTIPGINQYVNSDPYYQQGVGELNRVLRQFKQSNMGSRADVYDAFKTASQRMGDERGKALSSLKDDFAARGILDSGLYAGSVNDYNKEYTNRTTDLTKDRTDQLSNLGEEFANFQGLNRSKVADLKLDAIRRRAERYGIRS